MAGAGGVLLTGAAEAARQRHAAHEIARRLE
jgi:hypothetical protein